MTKEQKPKKERPKKETENRVKLSKEMTISSVVSTVSSLIVLLPATWFVVKPFIADSLAEDIKQVVQEESEPIKGAFTILLDLDINNTRREIAALEFRQRQGDDWTAEDAQDLAELKIELDALQAAREELDEEEEE